MIRVYKITLERRPAGYSIQEDVIFFLDAAPHDQCDKTGNPINDPPFSIDFSNQIITEIVDPEKLGLAEHAQHPIISNPNVLKSAWEQAVEHPQTIFTTIPVSIFPDLFHLELTI